MIVGPGHHGIEFQELESLRSLRLYPFVVQQREESFGLVRILFVYSLADFATILPPIEQSGRLEGVPDRIQSLLELASRDMNE
jgi:hypothetical protein